LEALKEKGAMEVVAKKYELLSNQILMRKSKTSRNLSAVFIAGKTLVVKNEILTGKLFA
jgi:hypothetical protein